MPRSFLIKKRRQNATKMENRDVEVPNIARQSSSENVEGKYNR